SEHALQVVKPVAAWRAMRQAISLIGAVAALLLPAAAHADAPVIGTLRLVAPQAYCLFHPPGQEAADPTTALFATELVRDDLVAAGRGYMRIGGLLRELELSGRSETEQLERRAYRTYGEDPVEVTVQMIRRESRKSAAGQVVQVLYEGT